MGTYFKHLNVPDHWNQYWTKYPEGYTILESLLNWVAQVDSMTDNVNNWNTYLDNFVNSFDKNVQGKVSELIEIWRADGTLGNLINEGIVNGLLEKIRIDVKSTGAKGDGNTDDTTAFNAAITKAISTGCRKIYVPAGTFLVDGVNQDPNDVDENGVPNYHYGNIDIPSDFEVQLHPQAVIQIKTNDKWGYAAFCVRYADNVYIHGGTINGDRMTHNYNPATNPYPTHEWGCGIKVHASSNVRIEDMAFDNMTGDGIETATDGTAVTPNEPDVQHLTIKNCNFYRARRNNISIVSGVHVLIEGCHIAEAGKTIGGIAGVLPGAGIDLEANGSTNAAEKVQAVTIRKCHFEKNNNRGIENYNGNDIVIEDCFFDELLDSIDLYPFGKNITVKNCTINKPIWVYGDNVTIKDNTLKDTSINIDRHSLDASTAWHNILIKDNLLLNSIIIGRASGGSDNCKIESNRFYNCVNTAIGLIDGNKYINALIIRGNEIVNCQVIPINWTGSYLVVEENNIVYCYQSGIRVGQGSTFSKIVNNIVRDFGMGTLAGTYTGIYVYNANDVIIKNNEVHRTTAPTIPSDSAIYLYGARCICKDNTVKSTPILAVGVQVWGNDCIVAENYLKAAATTPVNVNTGITGTTQTPANYV